MLKPHMNATTLFGWIAGKLGTAARRKRPLSSRTELTERAKLADFYEFAAVKWENGLPTDCLPKDVAPPGDLPLVNLPQEERGLENTSAIVDEEVSWGMSFPTLAYHPACR